MLAAEKLAALRNARMESAIVIMDCANLYGTASHRPENPDARFSLEILSTIQHRQMMGFHYAEQERRAITPHFLARLCR